MNLQDAWTFNLAGSYDFGFMKTYLATQYFKDARDAGSVLDYVGFFDEDSVFNNNEGDAKFNKGAVANTGYGVHLSTAFDVLGGTMKAGIGYMDADIDYANDGQVGLHGCLRLRILALQAHARLHGSRLHEA